MDFEHLYLIAVATIFNVAVVMLIMKASGAVDLRGVLREKNTQVPDSRTVRAAAAGAALGAGAAAPSGADPNALAGAAAAAAGGAIAAAQGNTLDPNQPGDSYSRITGLVGTAVLVCFIWAVGNTVIYNAFLKPESVKQILDGVASFILASSALFAPYAFNQLAQVFQKGKQ